jgi:hypothetical protein
MFDSFWCISGVQSRVKIVSWKSCFSLYFGWNNKNLSLYNSFLYITNNCHIDCYHLFQDYLEQEIKHVLQFNGTICSSVISFFHLQYFIRISQLLHIKMEFLKSLHTSCYKYGDSHMIWRGLPPQKFWKLDTKSCILMHFWGAIQSQNCVMKVMFFSLFRVKQ